jgi:putative transposase
MCSPAHSRYLNGVSAKVCSDFGAVLAEGSGEDDHMHLLADYPPKVPSRAGELARGHMRAHAPAAVPDPYHRDHLWSPSYLAASCGAAPLSIIRQYVEQQRTPDS